MRSSRRRESTARSFTGIGYDGPEILPTQASLERAAAC